MRTIKVLPLLLGAAVGVLFETGLQSSIAHACSCDDWVSYIAMEVEGPLSAGDAWLRDEPRIYLRVAGKLVITDSVATGAPHRVYPHEPTEKDGL